MINRLLALGVWALLAGQLHAQEGVEYWFGVDPGAGNGTFITGSASQSLSIPTTGLADGVHRCGLRPRNADGTWGLPQFVAVRVDDPDAHAVTGGEYFWNADPGLGGGTAIGLAELQTGRISLSTSGLPLGLHHFGLRLQNDDGLWGVTVWDSLTICTNYGVTPAFEIDVYGNTVYVSSSTQHADELVWTLAGDTALVDSIENPTYELPAGDYVLSQSAWNECDSNSVHEDVTIRGATSVLPAVGALGSTHRYDAMGAFDDLATVTLANGTTEFTPDFEVAEDGTLIFMVTYPDSTTTSALGFYDLCTTFEDGSETCLESAVEVGEMVTDFRSSISGPANVRLDVPTPYEITVENTGNHTLYAVPVAVIVGGPCEVWYPFSTPSEEYLPDSVYLGDALQDELNERHALRTYSEMDGDSIWINATFIPALVPGVPVTFTIEVKPTGIGDGPITVRTQMGPPWVTEEQVLDHVATLTSLGSPAANGVVYWECDAISMVDPCLDTFSEIILMIPQLQALACVASAGNFGCALAECLNQAWYHLLSGIDPITPSAGSLSLMDQCLSDVSWALIVLASCALPGNNTLKEGIEALMDILAGIDDAGDIEGAIGDLFTCQNCFAFMDCGDADGSAVVVASVDPNEKSGPLGWGEDHWIAVDAAPMHYRISCENADSATAPAAQVRMVDTLDLALFDVHSLLYQRLAFADSSVLINEAGPRFVREFDLQPEKNAILRLVGDVDTLSGVLEINWTSLDPETRSLTYDIDAGFLNPNVDAPEGEAYIAFTIDLLPDAVVHESHIENVADIYFDANDAIRTDVWSNRMDGWEPSAVIQSGAAYNDSTMRLVLEAVDAHSGVRYIDIYRDSVDAVDGSDQALFLGRYPAGDTLFVPVATNDSIQFFAVATDGVGNREPVELTYGFEQIVEWVFVPSNCFADFDGDHSISVEDLLLLLGNYASNSGQHDLNEDGEVGVLDLLLFLTYYGEPCTNSGG